MTRYFAKNLLVKADVEKVKANFGHSATEKQVAYAKADIKADAEKAKADAENKKADVEKKIQID